MNERINKVKNKNKKMVTTLT